MRREEDRILPIDIIKIRYLLHTYKKHTRIREFLKTRKSFNKVGHIYVCNGCPMELINQSDLSDVNIYFIEVRKYLKEMDDRVIAENLHRN